MTAHLNPPREGGGSLNEAASSTQIPEGVVTSAGAGGWKGKKKKKSEWVQVGGGGADLRWI